MARDSGTTWHPILRSILDHWVWSDKPFAYGQAWIDLILLAQHSPIKKVVNQQSVELDMGQLCWPRFKLAERWGWGRGRCDRFLDRLTEDGMMSISTSSRITVITLNNYKELHDLVKSGQAAKQAPKPAPKQTVKGAAKGAAIQKGEKEDLSPPSGDRPGSDGKGEGLPPTMEAGQETPGAPAAAGDAKPKAPRKPDLIWDTICELFSLKPVEAAEKKRVGKVVATLKRKSATPEKIRAVYAKMDGSLDWAPFSPEGLVKWYDQLSAPAKPTVAQSTVYEPRL